LQKEDKKELVPSGVTVVKISSLVYALLLTSRRSTWFYEGHGKKSMCEADRLKVEPVGKPDEY